jgi:hypothetical protein
MNEVFYYSLFDTESFKTVFDDDAFSYRMLTNNIKNLKEKLQEIFPSYNPYTKSKSFFNKFVWDGPRVKAVV